MDKIVYAALNKQLKSVASGFDHATKTGDNTFSVYFTDGSHVDLTIPIPSVDLSEYQTVISDLDDIRSGAALGATAIQSHQDISGKQDKLTAGTNITIQGNVISATGSSGDGLTADDVNTLIETYLSTNITNAELESF